MKEPWCLATSERDATAATLINHSSKRGTIEPQFRDAKDLRFGMGLASTRISSRSRRNNEDRIVSSAEIHGKLYTVVWMWRGGNQRIISFRRARDGEERAYRQTFG